MLHTAKNRKTGKPKNRKKRTKIGISIKSLFNLRVHDYFALKASYLYRFIAKDEKNQVFLFTHGETDFV